MHTLWLRTPVAAASLWLLQCQNLCTTPPMFGTCSAVHALASSGSPLVTIGTFVGAASWWALHLDPAVCHAVRTCCCCAASTHTSSLDHGCCTLPGIASCRCWRCPVVTCVPLRLHCLVCRMRGGAPGCALHSRICTAAVPVAGVGCPAVAGVGCPAVALQTGTVCAVCSVDFVPLHCLYDVCMRVVRLHLHVRHRALHTTYYCLFEHCPYRLSPPLPSRRS